jgi:hypothetical protein
MEICRSRFIAHVPINAADVELYMNVKVIIVAIHSNMVNVYYVAHFEMRKNNYAIQINDIYDQIYLVYWGCFSFSCSTMINSV